MWSMQRSRAFYHQWKTLRKLTKDISPQSVFFHSKPYNILPVCQYHALSLNWYSINCVYSQQFSRKHCVKHGNQSGTFLNPGISHSGHSGLQCNRLLTNLRHSNQPSLLHRTKDPRLCRHIGFSPGDIVKASPPIIQPYLRLIRFDRPIGTYLLFWPCTWSIGLAAQAGHLPDPYILALFALGSFVMRGAGCIINDMWDKDIDKMVERTKSRPLASGELTQFQALVFLGANLSVALAILLQLNWYSVFLGAASMGLVISYPLAKRYTYWPQLVLGLTFNYGAMLGWCAVKGALAWPIIPLYSACLLWTLIYDTIYAHQDKYDDMLIGVKSTALKLGDQTKPWLAGFSGLMVASLALTGHMCDQTWPYFLAVGGTALHLAHQLYTVDLNNPDDCLKKFKSNANLGALMFLGIVLGTLLKPSTDSDQEEKARKDTD